MSSVHQLAIAIRLLVDETSCQQKEEKRENRLRGESNEIIDMDFLADLDS